MVELLEKCLAILAGGTGIARAGADV